MKQYVLPALLKALVMSVCFTLLCAIYGFISNNPYEITFIPEVIFFLLFFFVNFIEYLWKNRKK